MKALRPEVSAKYALVGLRPGKYSFKNFGEIDLCALTLAKADDLFRKGFQFLKLREGASAGVPSKPKTAKTFPIGGKKTTEKNSVTVPKTEDLEKLRGNKKYVNQLLTVDYAELSDIAKEVFFNYEKYFLTKKDLLQQVSETDRTMQSIHANLKAMAKDDDKEAERGDLMNELSRLEETKLELFAKIDTWEKPASAPTGDDAIKAKAAEEAIKKQKLIEAHENYIYRNEPSLSGMPEETPAQKKKKAAKAAEIQRRKEELIQLGKPYNRQSRK